MGESISSEDLKRDHLFISYANEDYVLAEWLSLKLTSEGYKVWCDRFKLLGGESYPRDIDKALKEKTFRVLALLSHSSIKKENPEKERTMAINIGKERGIDFLIPLNVDGLSPTELNWMTSNITYIPFHKSWADGLSRLLKKLESIKTPRKVENGKEIACKLYLDHITIKKKPEQIYSNCLMVKQIPDELFEIRFINELSRNEEELLRDKWAFYTKDSYDVFAFYPPPDSDIFRYKIIDKHKWHEKEIISGIYTKNIVKNLLKRSLNVKCIQKGLRRSEVGRIYFPFGLFKKENLHFTSFTGRKSYVQVAGERHVPYEFQYNLAPSFQAIMREDGFLVRIFINFYLTEITGEPLESNKATTRHKALRKTLWNRDFLNRCMAICEYLSDENDEIIIGENEQSLVFDNHLMTFNSTKAIDDSKAKEPPESIYDDREESDYDESEEEEEGD